MNKVLRRMLTTVLTLLLATYLALGLLAYFSDRIIFQPQRSSYSDDQFPGEHRVLKLQSVATHPITRKPDRATISAVYLPNPNATYTLLFSHGNAEDIGDDLPVLEEYRNAGFAVFAFDYRGYGTSEGRPNERNVYAD